MSARRRIALVATGLVVAAVARVVLAAPSAPAGRAAHTVPAVRPPSASDDVPAPASLTLLGSGAALLGAVALRRRG